MPVLIVSKTRMHGDHVCVGGFDLDTHRNVRLLNAQGYNQPANTPYQIGEVWDLVYRPRAGCEPPHIEDVLVTSSRRVGNQPNLADYIRKNCLTVTGPLNTAFGGRSEEHTSELQSQAYLVCRLLLDKINLFVCSFLTYLLSRLFFFSSYFHS